MRTLVVDHPLVTHKLTALRDAASDTATFRSLTAELVTLLAYEATREIRVQPVSVATPVGGSPTRPAPTRCGIAGRSAYCPLTQILPG
jgi:uracil phosphoribosyltransferase